MLKTRMHSGRMHTDRCKATTRCHYPGGSAQGVGLPPGGTDTSKNITFHAVGNDATLKFWNYTVSFSPSSYQNFGGFHLLDFLTKKETELLNFL